jgi:hypothetical protein
MIRSLFVGPSNEFQDLSRKVLPESSWKAEEDAGSQPGA